MLPSKRADLGSAPLHRKQRFGEAVISAFLNESDAAEAALPADNRKQKKRAQKAAVNFILLSSSAAVFAERSHPAAHNHINVFTLKSTRWIRFVPTG